MCHYHQTTSYRLISQALCFCLLLQGSGIAQALPLPPKKIFISKSELEAARLERAAPDSGQPVDVGSLERFFDQAWATAEDAGTVLGRWLEDRWPESAAGDDPPLRVAQAGGTLPLPPRLMSAFLASSNRGQAAPPRPPDLGSGEVEDTPPTELANLLAKSAIEQVPLLAGLNLVSIPEVPADTDPAAVFAAAAGELSKVTAHDACDLTDPWKVYDPADPAASDLTTVDHRKGMWVSMAAAAALPSDGILPATTTIELCEGWNLIGFPTAEPRHPHAALSSIAGKWQRIFAYDAFDPDDPWEVFSIDVPDWANDLRLMKPGRGYWVLATEAVTLEIRNQGPPPTVAIDAPADLAVVTEPTEIIGTVESDRLESWTMTYRPIGDGDAVTLATGNTPVTGGTLATFDPTLLLNGLYELELTATDVQGQQVTESIAISVEGQMKIGHFTLSFVDLAIPVSGLDIEIVRTYDSRDKQPRDFGVGWSLDIRQGSYRNNRPPGDGWQLQTGFVACDTALESKSHLTVVRLSDQEVYRFALRLVRGVPRDGGGCSATAEFDYVDGPLPGTTLAILGNDQVFQEAPSSNRVLDLDTFATYEPQQVRMTTRDGRIFELDLSDGVTLVEDLNGNQLSITPAGTNHSSGKGIAFERDAEGRIIRITDPIDRVMTYAYDGTGNHVRFTDRAGAVTHFIYDGDHRLLDVIDPRGVRAVRSEYDAEGRLLRHVDAFGKVIELGHDRDHRREVVTNRLTEKTDPTGYRLSYSYDPQGNRTSLTATVGLQVFTTTYGYDELNRLETVTAAQGGVTAITYDENGNQASLVFPNSLTTDFTYDQLNRLTDLSTASGVGNVLQSYAYTLGAAGNRARVDEHDGTSRHYLYDDLYQLTQDRVTDASSVLVYQRDFVYDAVGNRTEQKIDEGSGPTAVGSTYDDRDRLLTAATASYGWDTNGNLTAQDETSYGWDFENRLTSAILADGTVVETRYDADGNRVRTAVTPPGGPTTALDYLVDTTGFLSHVVAEVVGGSVQTLYTRADDQLIGSYQPVSGASSYFHADGLGSVRGLSDELGGITDRYSYTAFGELLEHTGSSFNPYQFAAEPFDPNVGFSYNRARWMDVASGRSLSIDPLAGVGHDPATLHRYSYSLNDPVNRLDPSGEASLLNISIAAAIVNGLAAAALTAYRGGNAGEIVLNGIGVAAATFLLLYYGIPAIEALLVRFWPAIFASSVASGLVVGSTGQLPRSTLLQAARSSGRTVEFYTRLKQAPEVGRQLYTATGPAARELANAARSDGVLYLARIPWDLIRLLQSIGLATHPTQVIMRGKQASEVVFLPQASEFIVRLFTRAPLP